MLTACLDDPTCNTGQISGHGTLATGGLTNNGSMTLTGGFTTVNGPLTNDAVRPRPGHPLYERLFRKAGGKHAVAQPQKPRGSSVCGIQPGMSPSKA